VLANLRRVSSQSAEPWFHRPVLEYWRDLWRCVGPVFVAGFWASLALWATRLVERPAVVLVAGWAVLMLAFCSAIGLRHERYFLPAVPAIAVIVGALASRDTYDLHILRRWPAVATVVRAVVVVLALVGTGVLCARTISGLDDMARVAERSNTFYARLGAVLRDTVPVEDRLLLSRPQTVYFAERNYFLSEYDPSVDNLIATLANPDNRITFVVQDSSGMFHPEVSAADRQKFWDHVTRHFTPIALPPGLRAAVHRRTSW